MNIDLKAIRERADGRKTYRDALTDCALAEDVPALLDLVDEQQRTIDAMVGALRAIKLEVDDNLTTPIGATSVHDIAVSAIDAASRDAERARRADR